ncbi:MAG TPA: polysaccharide deacetylase family protein [Candidatus Woesebacteria bacterium]|nr:polysaccharide deacetylase family protein [Candidatus Woesebacteria bacterium]
MKRPIGIFLFLIFILMSCSISPSTSMATADDLLTPDIYLSTVTSTPSPTIEPVLVSERQKIRLIMEGYGVVEESQLNDEYWERLASQVSKYGEAKRILTLEYHGDNYNMYDGTYSMNPEEFESEMRYLLDNDYHFVTGPELVGYLEGWLKLPTRSIILTTDSGGNSDESMPRMIALFGNLEAEYGVAPHMISFIWTTSMDPELEIQCRDDACWQTFREAIQSGYFTIGSHTETHRDFSTLTDVDTTWDLETAAKTINSNLGINVYGISWPFEKCSTNPTLVSNMGYKFAFGGFSRDRYQLFTYSRDNEPLCLPRLFPPNRHGISGRPSGMTLAQMLDEMMNAFAPLE